MPFPTGLRALNHRSFRHYWLGQLVSMVGRWMQAIGQSWLVLELTGSPLKLGIVNALQFAPILLLSFVAGAIADRVEKRQLLVGTQVGLMVPALAVAVLTWSGHIRYWHVALMAAAMGVANALDMPTRQSLVVELVGKDDLTNAIALNSALFNAARVVGPALGGLLIARYGVAATFLLNGLTYLPVIAALLAMHGDPPPRASRDTSMRQEIADGLRYAVRSPVVSLILSLVLSVSVFAINHNVLVPLVARDVLGEAARGFGFLMAALGVGAFVAAALLAQFGRHRPALVTVVASALVTSAGILSLAVVRHFWVAAAVLFVVGLAQILFLAGSNTILQLTVPDALRGRVMSLYVLAFAGVSPLGSLLIGSIAEAFGPAAACLAGGGLGLVCVLLLTAGWSRRSGPEPAQTP
jgi:MFS family permease